jgi:hypothetical protein
MGMIRRRAVVWMTAFVVLFVVVFLAIFGLLTLVGQVSAGQVKPGVLGETIIVIAEVTIAIAVSGEVFVMVSTFLLNVETRIITI